MAINKTELSFLNQLTSEIIILNEDLKIVWLNYSALNKGWVIDDKNNLITNQLSEVTNSSLVSLFKSAIRKNLSQTKRDFELINSKLEKREIDLTVRWSNSYECLIVEILCVDNLNKMVDSSKTFSIQKIAANLARTLAHEVKNPLSGIKGSAQILSKKLQDDFSTKFLKIIINETDRLNDIVTKILTPPSKPNLALFNIHSALEQVYALADADDNKVELIRDYDPSIPEINGDENLFIQAILNIVKNAQQAVENTENASITIKSRIQFGKPINGTIHPTVCSIEIKDNGPGIPNELQDQVFFPMVSVKDQGSGLGLTIAQDIIRIHGGGIIFSSNPGSTVFSIQIPLKLNNKESQIA
ncbi:MAG: histidine kinase [Gammaproteobacteria bacterium]|mgnify:FL=1|jgi:two-component system nitrogen regulation sensor histidine kinase GlnL|nr:histidine kinase [Gammaproteobacteria bacterium]|tara:strand:- start:6516 stop:7589 length:1074 start_codon:yes stop_codon:yes gene_type:complete